MLADRLSDALVTVLDDISSSPCNDTDQKHHQMYHFQTWIQWQQTVRKQAWALSREARTRMIRAVGEVWLPGWWIVICAMGTMPWNKIAMCPPVTWSDQSRMFTRRFPFSLSLIFTTSECKAAVITVYCFCPGLCLLMPEVISRCCPNVNMEIVPGMLTLSPLSIRHQHLSPLSPPLLPMLRSAASMASSAASHHGWSLLRGV